jgi:tripartite-type tricarboxylate transporter receptor subunit TctC
MNAEMAKALKIPAVQERLTEMGVQVMASSPEDFGKFIGNEVNRWGKVVRENGIKAGQ